LFIDRMDPTYKVNATETIKHVIAETIEGLAWGPAFKDGRQVLYVFSDNDVNPRLPTQSDLFAVDTRAAGIGRSSPLLRSPATQASARGYR